MKKGFIYLNYTGAFLRDTNKPTYAKHQTGYARENIAPDSK